MGNILSYSKVKLGCRSALCCMLDVGHLVCLPVSPTLLTWFLFKNILNLFSVVFVHNEIVCFVIVNLRMEVKRNSIVLLIWLRGES